METLTIGQVADAAGINASAIRYYERNGILPEPERVSGQRRYDEEVLNRLSILAVAKQAGFTLEEVKELLTATDAGEPAHAELRELAQAKLPQIDALIEHAQEVKRWLEASSRCTCNDLGDCSLFDLTANGPLSSSC